MTALAQARRGAQALRVWCWGDADQHEVMDAFSRAVVIGGGDPSLWRIDLIVKDVVGGELGRLGFLDAAFCGGKLANAEEKERQRYIEALSRLIATDGYLYADGMGERLRDRFTRDPAVPGLYRPTALTVDLSFL